jgi:flagellar biogenesis protein FliO
MYSAVYSAEAERSVGQLKGEPASAGSAAPITMIQTSPTPAAESNSCNKQPLDSTMIPNTSTPSVESSSENRPISETYPGLMDDKKSETGKPGWDMDPKRGKPAINLGLIAVSLIVVCVIAYFGLKFYSMYTTGEQQSPIFSRKKLIVVRERQVLAPNKMLCVVELPDKTVLLGVTETEIKILTDIPQDKIDEFENQATVENSDRPTAASYLSDIFLRKWQGDK